MNILKPKFLLILFIILLVCSSCVRIEFDSKEKKSIRKEVEKTFSKIKTIDFSDFSEDFDDKIKEHHEWVKKYVLNEWQIKYSTDYLNEVIFKIRNVKEGNTLIDLGSGFGIDCLLLRQIIIGDKGKIIGIDIEESYNVVARKYSEYLGYDNVDFILGDARELPFDDNIADVVISNYTLTLIEEKEKVFSEIYRVLKDGGNCYIGDAIIYGKVKKHFDLFEKTKNNTLCANYHTCFINTRKSKEEYLEILERIGYRNIKIRIHNFSMVDDEGNVVGLLNNWRWIDKFRYRNKIISAGVYIYAEK